MKPNCERISRKAEAYQWTGSNVDLIMGVLARHGLIGELFRGLCIQVYKDGSYSTTLHIGTWLVIGEDLALRFYSDEEYRLMYQPINDELERLRAFACGALTVPDRAVSYGPALKAWARECGLTVDSLKAQE